MAVLQSPITFIASIPPVTRYFTVATVFTSVVHAWFRWKGTDITDYLALVAGYSLFRPWTFLSSVLLETNVLGVSGFRLRIRRRVLTYIILSKLIFTLITIPPSLRYLERIWGSVEILKFIIVTVVASNVITFGFSWLEYFATGGIGYM